VVAFSMEIAVSKEVFSVSLFQFVIIALILDLKYFVIPSFLLVLEQAVIPATLASVGSFDHLIPCYREVT